MHILGRAKRNPYMGLIFWPAIMHKFNGDKLQLGCRRRAWPCHQVLQVYIQCRYFSFEMPLPCTHTCCVGSFFFHTCLKTSMWTDGWMSIRSSLQHFFNHKKCRTHSFFKALARIPFNPCTRFFPSFSLRKLLSECQWPYWRSWGIRRPWPDIFCRDMPVKE